MERFKELLEKLTCTEDCDGLNATELVELRELTLAQYNSAKESKNLPNQEKFGKVLAAIKTNEDALAAEEATIAERQAELDREAGLAADEKVPKVEETEELADESTPLTEVEVEKEPVVASVRIELGDIDLSQFRTREEAPEEPEATPRFLSLTAAAVSPAVNEGAEIRDRDTLQDHFMGLYEAMTKRGTSQRTYGATGIAETAYAGEVDFERSTDPRHVTKVLWDVAEAERTLALTADGSFCAPVEPDLRFCDLTGPITGTLQLPTVRAPRGQLQYMATPRFDDMYALTGIGELFTEADSIAVDPDDTGTWKTCAAVDCPSQQSVTAIDAIYSCLTYKHFTANSYPEYIDFFIRNALKIHVYKQNAELMTKVLAEAVALAADIALPLNSTAALLNAYERNAYALKRAYWLSDDTVVNLALPEFVRLMIRADIAIRQFGDINALFAVTDAEIDAMFNKRGLRVQWLKNWQRVGTTGTAANEALGAVGDLALWPTTFDAIAWIPGTLVAMEAPNFNIGFDVIRDATLIRQNAYQGFVETFEGLATPCDHQVQQWTVSFCPAGETSGPVTLDCDELRTAAG